MSAHAETNCTVHAENNNTSVHEKAGAKILTKLTFSNGSGRLAKWLTALVTPTKLLHVGPG